jgi:hypothetical protein
LTLAEELVIHIVIKEDLEITLSSSEVLLSRRNPNLPTFFPAQQRTQML